MKIRMSVFLWSWAVLLGSGGVPSQVIASGYVCDPQTCQLPKCQCPSLKAPGTIPTSDTPQFIVLTFGEAVTERFTQSIQPLLKKHAPKKLASGRCALPATFLTSIAWADFYSILELWKDGHEIGSRGFGSFLPDYENAQVTDSELVASVAALVGWTGIPEEDIRGFRSPGFIQSAATYSVLQNTGKYDTTVRDRPGSLTTGSNGNWSWPFTLSSGVPSWECPDCYGKYDTVWELPVPILLDVNDAPIAGGLEALMGNDALVALRRDFDKRFTGNKSPFVLSIQPGWFLAPGNAYALDSFITYVQSLPGVYFVTGTTLISWMKAPVGRSSMETWDGLKCPNRSSHGDTVQECIYTVNPEASAGSRTPFYYRTKTALTGCPKSAPSIAEPVPAMGTSCAPPTGGCLYGTWRSDTCKCACLGETLAAQNGWCRDSIGRCTVLKTWEESQNMYQPCGSTRARAPGACDVPFGGCSYGSYDPAICACKCTNERDTSQIGWCKDSLGRCSILKIWDASLQRYAACS